MQNADLAELLRPYLNQGVERRRITDYAAILVLVLIIVGTVISFWRNNQLAKIESIELVPNSVVVIGPADSVSQGGLMEFCPGDRMTIRYLLDIEGEGTIYADDAAHHGNQTVKFSELWRDIVVSGVRPYENEWEIPARPDMPIDGQREWVSGLYTRTISVQASNLYVSRYVSPATFPVVFRMRNEIDCLD